MKLWRLVTSRILSSVFKWKGQELSTNGKKRNALLTTGSFSRPTGTIFESLPSTRTFVYFRELTIRIHRPLYVMSSALDSEKWEHSENIYVGMLRCWWYFPLLGFAPGKWSFRIAESIVSKSGSHLVRVRLPESTAWGRWRALKAGSLQVASSKTGWSMLSTNLAEAVFCHGKDPTVERKLEFDVLCEKDD